MTRLSRTTLFASLLTIGAVFGTGVEARAADIVIGVVGVMSGPYAIWGENLREGATLAAETINEKGGVGGHRFSLLFRDDEANPTKSVTAVTELIERQKVDGLVASATTGATLAILPYIAKARIPHFLASSSGTNIDPRLNPFTFKTVQSDSLLAKEMARYLVKDRKFKKIGIFHVADGFGNNLKTFYTSALSELGIPPASVQSINNGETDATSQVLRLRQDGVEAIMVGALEPELATLLRSMEKIGFSVPAVSSDISVTGSFFNLMANKIPDFLFAVRGRGLTYSAQQPLGPQVKGFVARVNRRLGIRGCGDSDRARC